MNKFYKLNWKNIKTIKRFFQIILFYLTASILTFNSGIDLDEDTYNKLNDYGKSFFIEKFS
ncbi:MAG: hypothetical protein ABIF17_01625 [Patescibacteria group bacterium]